MTLKRLYVWAAALLVGVAVAACQKEPDSSDLNDDYLVYTDYDSTQDFARYDTFFIPDSILIIGGDKAEYWNDDDAREVVATVAACLEGRGYVRSAAKEDADLGLQLSYVEQVSYFVGYDRPSWWWDYPYYWLPGYWGDWYGWYCPYRVFYNFTAGSLLTEMLDLHSPQSPGEEKKLTVVWDSFIGGLLTSNSRLNQKRTLEGVEQAFRQSPYLHK